MDEACTLFTDGDWVESKDQSLHGIRLIQTGNVGFGNFKNRADKARYITASTFARLRCQEVRAGDCLVSRLPDPVGRSCIVPDTGERMITAVDCTVIRFSDSSVIPKFFNYYSQSAAYLRQVDMLCSGATRKRISRKNLGRVAIPEPPLAKQKRIVAILDQAFAGIDKAIANTEKNLANARELFESYLNGVFNPNDTDWPVKPVSEMADHCLGKMLDKQKNKGQMEPYLRNVNVQWFSVNTDDLKQMKIEGDERSRYSVMQGDLLICEGGYPGRAAIWKNPNGIFFQKALHRVRCHTSAHNAWLLYYLYHLDASDKLSDYFSGTGIQHFTGRSLKNLPVPWPSEADTHKLLSDIHKVQAKTEQLESVHQRKLAALTALKQSLLHKAFSGELTANPEREMEAALP